MLITISSGCIDEGKASVTLGRLRSSSRSSSEKRDETRKKISSKKTTSINGVILSELIAEVRGNVGYPLLEPQNHMTMYFKFGMYRDPLPGTIHFHFDNFRQGTSRMDV